MRLLAAILTLCVCGCYSPHYGDCLISCETSQLCPSDLFCDGHDCRTSETPRQTCIEVLGDAGLSQDSNDDDGGVLDVGTADDLDGDGVPNLADNCPTKSNTLQDDEDGDSKGDACDPCPPYMTYIAGGGPADADADGDGDGVGDGCDPEPGLVNHIVLFDAFNRRPLPPAQFEEIGGAAWTFDGEAKATINVSPQRLTINWPGLQSGYVSSYVTWVGESATGVGAGPFALGVANMNSAHACMFWNTSTSGSHTLGLIRLPTTADATAAYDYQTLPNQITFGFRGSTRSCGATGVSPVTGQLSNFPTPSVSGITANGMSARFKWIMIVD